MKKYIFTIFVAVGSLSYAQQGEVHLGSTTASRGVLMDFDNTVKKGIILPQVTSAPSDAVDGTFVFDGSDKKVKARVNGQWLDLSNVANTGVARSAINLPESNNAKVIVGAQTTQVPGALVLESTTQALVLPKFSEVYKSIVNPTPGMLAYDSTNDLLCVWNGSQWTFWTFQR